MNPVSCNKAKFCFWLFFCSFSFSFFFSVLFLSFLFVLRNSIFFVPCEETPLFTGNEMLTQKN